MCCRSKDCKCKGHSWTKFFKWLLVIGGLNWGLVGLGWLFGGKDWNLVHGILGSWPTLEAIIYILVGLAAVIWLFGGCKHGKDHNCVCGVEDKAGSKMGGTPGGSMPNNQGKM